MINLADKKILVTGADGFVGRHLVKNLLEKREVKPENLFLPTVKDMDLRDVAQCKKAVEGVDAVIHLAAKVGGIGFNMEHPGELFYDNLVMGVHLMEAARQAGVKKFVGIATVCAYPKFAPVPFSENDLWNGYPEETNAPYGLAKKMLLVQAQAYRAQYGFNAVTLFPVNMYGPGDTFDPKKSHVIAALIKKIYEAKRDGMDSISVWGTGKASREFLYVADAAEAILLAAERYDNGEPVNIGSGKEITIKDLAETICRLMDFTGNIVWDASKPDGQPRRMLDTSRAAQEFGFASKTDFMEGLRQTIDWYIKTQERPTD